MLSPQSSRHACLSCFSSVPKTDSGRGGLVPAAIVARELGIRIVETVSVASYDYDKQGEVAVLKAVSAEFSGKTQSSGILIVDDLVDTGATAKVVREMLPKAHFATVYAKPLA